jgi:hypothetical protein
MLKRPNGNSEGATFVDRKDKLITEGYVPPIHDFGKERIQIIGITAGTKIVDVRHI